MESRVGALDLRVRAPAERAAALVPAARGFTCRVLERCDELLEQRAPGRLLFMRCLDMQWRLWEHGVESADEVEAVAAEMARALDAQARAGSASPDLRAEIVVFEDEVHYRAEYLHAVAERRAESCWFFKPLIDEGAPAAMLLRREHRLMTALVLRELAVGDRLEQVLAALPPAAVDELTGTLATIAEMPAGAAAEDPVSASPHVGARTPAPNTTSSPFEVAPQSSVKGNLQPLPGRNRAARLSDDDASAPSEIAVPTGPPRPGVTEVEALDTAFGGLFYLLSPALELAVGDMLWTACLPETTVLTCVAAAILGANPSADPAPYLFGGATPDSRLIAVTREQHVEVSTAMLAATVSALPRRQLAELPSCHLFLAGSVPGRLLVAAALESPFAVFAWPADSHDAIREGLTTFLAQWPASAPAPLAQPALASLDRSARIKTTRSAGAPRLLLPNHEDLFATAVLTQTAGSLAFLFGARAVAADITVPAQLVERYFTLPARVAVTEDEMEIRIPTERIELAIRRAGVDRDPGWVPWLQKHVRFAFAGRDEVT